MSRFSLFSTHFAILSLLLLLSTGVLAQSDNFVVKISDQPDEKAIFATVESLDVVPARTRISGTIAELKISAGDPVEQGQVIALISDSKNALRIRALNAQIAAAKAEVTNAETELSRAKDLFDRGIFPKAKLDTAITRADVARGRIKSLSANRNLISQEVREGQVKAPMSGRVLNVPVTAGTVMLRGETIARIAAENYVLRLQLPERDARFMKIGGDIRVDGSLIDGSNSKVGKITRVYPQIVDGKVIADSQVQGLGDFFVGERVRVWIPVQTRRTILIPMNLLSSQFGVDTVYLRKTDGSISQIIVQPGRQRGDNIEILSGLISGDELVTPSELVTP